MIFEKFERFDMTAPPQRQKRYLQPIIWGVSFPAVWAQHTKISRVNMDSLKPPYILLCNHNSFYDFMVASAAIFPKRANYVVAIDGFIKREALLRKVGCICKRKFTNDITLIRQLRNVIKNGDIAVLYPEARYSLCGTTAVLPDSVGKLAKLLKVPVVTLITHGNHVRSPFWNTKKRALKQTTATIKQLISAEDIETLSHEEINDRIRKEFIYDDFAWQKENKIKIDDENRAKGLHKVLYQCPHCGKEYKMASDGIKLRCEACKKEWEMTEYGELKALDGETEFSHIPDWYEWERQNVRQEVENGTYSFTSKVIVDSLPNAKGFIRLGEGDLTHDINGFTVTGEYDGEPYKMEKPVASLYSCHIEYEYLGKYGDCIDLNTLEDTFYIYPQCEDFSITKIALATEELFEFYAPKKAKKLDRKEPVMA